MSHYVCTGECGGVAEEAGTCSAESCSKSGQPLQECNCTDGAHAASSEPQNAE